MWQSNVSWQEGLLSEIPFKRFQAIKTKSRWDSPLAIFTRLNPNKGNDWPNLRLEGIQSSSSPTIGAMDTLFSPEYYIVAVDTRLRTTQCVSSIKTQDNITGKVQVTIEYQVSSLETLFSIDDPLSRLKDRTSEEIQDSVSGKSYFDVNEMEIKRNLQGSESQRETGIFIKKFVNLQINWPESITEKFQKGVLNKMDDKLQNDFNVLKIQKLKDFGINDPRIIASVLSQKDTDFDVIMGHVRSMSQSYQDQVNHDRDLLQWLADRDYLSRADVQKLIDPLTTRMNDQSSISSSLSNGLFTTSDSNQGRLDKKDDQGEAKQDDEQPIQIRKRPVNLSDRDNKK